MMASNPITNDIGYEKRDSSIVYYCGMMPIFSHQEHDLDSFRTITCQFYASGLIYGFLEFNDAAQAVEWGAAHGALAMTTPGDTTMVTRDEVAKLVGGGSARVDR